MSENERNLEAESSALFRYLPIAAALAIAAFAFVLLTNHRFAHHAWHVFGRWDAAVALSTVLLAAATAGMAWQTRRMASLTKNEVKAVIKQAKASTEHASIAESALSASIRPLLVDVPPGVFTVSRPSLYGSELPPTEFDRGEINVWIADNTADVYVPLWNVGPGLAFLRSVRLFPKTSIFEWSCKFDTAVPSQQLVVISLNGRAPDQTDAQMTAERPPFTLADIVPFEIVVNYAAADGYYSWTTTAHVEENPPTISSAPSFSVTEITVRDEISNRKVAHLTRPV